MATIKEIAELAGVSRGTVDRVINNRGAVNPATEKRILEIIESLDYQPNKAGMALAAQKRRIKIGLVLFEEDNPFFNMVEAGIREKMAELDIYGISYETVRCSYDPDEQLKALEEVIDAGVDGILLAPCDDVRIRDLINEQWEKGIPTATYNTDLSESKRIAYVGADNAVCGRTAAALLGLLTGGSAKVGIVSGSSAVLGHKKRIRNFTDYKSEGIEILDIIQNRDDDRVSRQKVCQMLEKHPDIDAVAFFSGGVYGGCQGLLDYEADHPEHKAPIVIAFDEVPSTVEMMKRDVITACICQQPMLQGALALEYLANYIVNGSLPEEEVTHTELTIRIKESL